MKIACVLITHLPVKVELRRYPEIEGKPVIIAEEYGSQQLVLDSSPSARGVVGGMPLQEATSRCKDARLLPADRPFYETAFRRVMDSLQQRSPLVERRELGCAYVGLDGLTEMYRGEAGLITSLLGVAPANFNPRVGVASGKFPAYVAAVTTGGGQATRAPDDAAGFLAGVSVDLLPLSWDARSRLHGFGLHTLGQLARLEVGAVQAQFGADGKRIWELANGIDPSPLVACPAEAAVSEYLTFPTPAVTRQEILTAVEALLGRTFARPEIRGKYVRGVTIASRVLHHSPWVRKFAFKNAVGSKDKALFVIKNGIESASLPGPLEDITLTLTGLAGESGAQGSLFSDMRKREQLREMMRQLETQLGGKPPIYQVRDIEPWSRIPERRQALVIFDP